MYTDRRDAGRRLATATEHLKGQSPVVVTIPRGGVPVAVEVALALKAPIEIVAVTKMVSSHAPDVEVGAVGSDGIEIIEPFMVHLSGLSSSDLDFALRVAHRRVGEISAFYRGNRDSVSLVDRDVLLVDDGIRSGLTVRVAVTSLRRRGVRSITVAVPVASWEGMHLLRRVVDEIICLRQPNDFYAIDQWFHTFESVSDREARHLLELVRPARPTDPPAPRTMRRILVTK